MRCQSGEATPVPLLLTTLALCSSLAGDAVRSSSARRRAIGVLARRLWPWPCSESPSICPEQYINSEECSRPSDLTAALRAPVEVTRETSQFAKLYFERWIRPVNPFVELQAKKDELTRDV